MALAAAVTWPENISIGRLGRTALSQAAEEMDVDTIIPSWKMIVCQSRKNGDASGRFERIHPHWSLMGQWSLYKYLPIVSTKLYVYDCGKWPSQAWQKCAEDKGLLKVSLTIIHHVWINDRRIIDFYRTRVRSLAMLVTNWLTHSRLVNLSLIIVYLCH